MVYAPRSEEELRVVMEIVKAAACWVRNERFFDDGVQKGVREKGALIERVETCKVTLVDPEVEEKKGGEEVDICCSVAAG